MTWIKTIEPASATGELLLNYKELRSRFPIEYSGTVPALTRPDGTSDSIVSAHSLFPSVMRNIFLALSDLMSPRLPLSRRQQEMIHTLVSSLNHCHY